MKARLTAADLAGVSDWQKSSRSTPNSDNCVEIAPFDGDVAMRNSNDPDAGGLRFTHAELSAFLDGAKAGEFDHLV